MTPPTYRPSTIYIDIDVSNLSLIDAERYEDFLRSVGIPAPDGCRSRAWMDLVEVEE